MMKVEVKQDTAEVKKGYAGSVLGTSKGDRQGGVLMITPPIGEDYWLFRVQVSQKQALIAFPKFGTIGIGFQVEEDDWNTNLPYTCTAEEIADHIKGNAVVDGDDKTPDRETVLEAIRLLQAAAAKAMEPEKAEAEQARKMHGSALAASVAAFNRAHAEANRLAAECAELFKPLIGKKIVRQDGCLGAKAQELFQKLRDTIGKDNGDQLYRPGGKYSLYFVLRVSEDWQREGADYFSGQQAEAHFTVGEIDKAGVLTKVETREPLRTDYTVEEVLRLRAAVRETRDAYHRAESALCPFKEWE